MAEHGRIPWEALGSIPSSREGKRGTKREREREREREGEEGAHFS